MTRRSSSAASRCLFSANFCADEQVVDVAQHLENSADLVIGNSPEPALPLDGSLTLRPWEANGRS